MAEPVKPQPSPGYVGMLIVTALAMVLGIVVMALEATEYDWDPKPKATQAIALPKGNAAVDAPVPAVAEAKPDAKPSAVAKTEPAAATPAVKLPDVKLPEVAKTDPKPPATGPVPSPLTLPAPPATTPTAAPKVPEAKPEPPKADGPTPSPLRFGR